MATTNTESQKLSWKRAATMAIQVVQLCPLEAWWEREEEIIMATLCVAHTAKTTEVAVWLESSERGLLSYI